MAELQRSSQTFRRSGSSGLVWDAKNQRAAGESTEDKGSESRELRHSRSAGSIATAQRKCSDGMESGRPGDGNLAFRTRNVPPALDPPSPKVPRCMFCGIFKKEVPSTSRSSSKPRKY